MKTIIIIQARMGSSRLPGKVLKPFGNSVELDYVVSRCRQVRGVTDVIVATSTLKQDTPIVDWCNENRVTCFRGSEDDVLSRYYECATLHNPDYVIRVTADCPFIDYELASSIVETMEKKPCDIIKVNGELSRGLLSEMISMSALAKIHEEGRKSYHREHVTYYAYENPEGFDFVEMEAPEGIRHPEFRITVDTEEDYEMCSRIAVAFSDNSLVSSGQVVRYLQEHPEIARINSHIQQKPVK